jgi:surface polysaccharide O-acyltransferase-like enzyme
MTSITHRDIALDYIRVLALFGVVLVHTHLPTGVTSIHTTWPELLLFYLGKLGVPLFVMVSGALLLSQKNDETLLQFYSNRLRRIVIPWIFWSIIYLMYEIYSHSVVITTLSAFIKELLATALSDFWFIPMILGLYIITPYLRKITEGSVPLSYLFVTWFTLTSLLPMVYLSPLFPGSSSAGLFTISVSFTGYYLMGWYLAHNRIRITTVISVLGLCVSALLYLLLSFIFKNEVNALFFVQHDYFSPPIVTGSVFIFNLLYQKYKNWSGYISSTSIITLSLLSYGIFLSHSLVVTLLKDYLPNQFLFRSGEESLSILIWLIKAVLVYSISMALTFLLSRLAVIRRYIT